MKFGFIKVAAAVPHVRVGDCEYNLQQTKDLFIRAAEAGAEVVVFPELGLTGYTCGDLFRQTLLIESAEKSLKEGLLGVFYYDYKNPQVENILTWNGDEFISLLNYLNIWGAKLIYVPICVNYIASDISTLFLISLISCKGTII